MSEKSNTNVILIVEDNPATQQLIAGTLENEHALIFASSYDECLKRLSETVPTLVLLDIVLPDGSGIDLCRMICADEKFIDTPVILVTAKTSDEDVRRGLSAGAVDYIKKPIHLVELTARVNSVLKMRRLVRKLRESDDEKQKLIENLQEALEQVKELSGLLPICSVCKDIRDDHGYWRRIEDYISRNSDARFSHGLCPKCYEKLYGNESWFPHSINEEKK